MKKQLVILDRDGVINHDSVDFVKSAEEWFPLGGSLQAINLLKERECVVVIASNQSGIGRKFLSLETLAEIHNKLFKLLLKDGCIIDGIFFCPHKPGDSCLCRKPLPGLINSIQTQFKCEFEKTLFIGDSQRDLDAAKAANVEGILVRSGNGLETEKTLPRDNKVKVFDNLLQAVNALTE